MRVVAWLTERIGHSLDQFFRDRVLQALCFDVHVAPVVAELARQIRFEDAVAADHLKCGATALRRQLHAAIRHMLDQSRLGETFHHAADGWRRDFEHFRDIAGCGETALTGEVENGLEVVFDGPRQRRLWGSNRGVHRLSLSKPLSTRQGIRLA